MRTKIFKILFRLLLWFVTAVVLLGAVLRSKTFQQWATHKAAYYLSHELNTKVSIAGFRVENLTQLHLDSVFIGDRHKDTAFFIYDFTVDLDRLRINFTDKEQRVHINYAHLNGGFINFKKYTDTGEWNYEFIIDYFSPPKDSTDTIPGRPFILKVNRFDITNSTFSFRNPSVDSSWEARFNPDDFRFANITGTLKNFSIVDDSLSFLSQNLSAREKNGFVIKNLTADSRIYSGGLEFYNLLLETDKSRLADELKMNYTDWDDMGEFVEKVVFSARLTKSVVSMEDVAYWGPNMDDLKQVLTINGQVRGTIDNLKGRGMRIDAGEETFLSGEFDIKGLPDFYASYIDLKVEKAQTTEEDLKRLMGVDSLPDIIKTLGKVDFTGKFTGFPKAFVAYGRFNTGLGRLSSDIKLDFTEGISTATYSGFLKTDGFDLGTFIEESPAIGKISFDAKINGTGLSMQTIDAEVKGNIKSITVNNYTYQNIEMDGIYAGRFFEGYVHIRDENLNVDFDGGIDFTSELPKMNFIATIHKADLYKIGLDSVPSTITGKVYLDFSGNQLDNISGTASVANVSYQRNSRLLTVDSATLTAGYTDTTRLLKVRSDIVDAEIIGQFNFSELAGAMKHYAATLLPHIIKEDSAKQVKENFRFSANFKKPQLLTRFFFDDISIDPFEARGSINTEINDVQLTMRAAQFRYGDMDFRHIGIFTTPEQNGVKKIELKCGELYIGDSLYLENGVASLSFDSNEVYFNISVPKSIARLSIVLKGRLLLTENLYKLAFSGSTITSLKRVWTISDDGFIGYEPKTGKILAKGVRVANNRESIYINGAIAKGFDDTLRVEFENFSVANANYFTLPPPGQELGGTLNGNIVLFNLYDFPLFTSDLTADSLSFGGDTLGDLSLVSGINSRFNKIITVNGGFSNGRLQGSVIKGFVNFDENAFQNLSLNFNLNNATARFFEPFLTGLVSNIDGAFSTNLSLKGTFKEPELSGSAALGHVTFKVDYLQTRYFIDTAIINITNTAFTAGQFVLKDEKGSAANAAGNVSHRGFKDFRVNFGVRDMNNFMVLNTTEADNSLYFGTAFMTGSYRISGPFDDLFMEVKAKTEKNTVFNLKLADENSVAQYDFITFITSENIATPENTVDLQGIRLNLALDVTPDAEVKIIFDSQLGDVMEGSGYANLRMEINTLGDFKMFGTYTIEKGEYLFTALDFINRHFTISKGGTITWTGDPLNARINLKAVYTKTTSVQPLIMGLVPDAELASYSTPVRVDAIMELRGQLMKPDIRFGLNIPDINALGGSNANTSIFVNAVRRIERDQEEMARQVFSLLSLGVLATPPDNGYVASAGAVHVNNPGLDAVTNSVGNLLSNQITNWLSKYDPRWNIGIQVGQTGYQQRTEFIISASRRWLNDRLQVDVAIDPNTTQGNFNVNYKLNPSGNTQVRAFSRNTTNPIYNQNILSFGTGFFFRTEFEDFHELKHKVGIGHKPHPVAPIDSVPKNPADSLNGRTPALPEGISFR